MYLNMNARKTRSRSIAVRTAVICLTNTGWQNSVTTTALVTDTFKKSRGVDQKTSHYYHISFA
jgi:K+-transporting ATPase A subunit